MNCEFWRGRLVEVARGDLPDAAVTEHLRACPACDRFLDRQLLLSSTLDEIAESEAQPPKDLETVLLAQFQAARPDRRRRWRTVAACGAVAAAAAGFALVGSSARHVEVSAPTARAESAAVSAPPAAPAIRPTEKPSPPPARHYLAPQPDVEAGPFVAIPYTLPLDSHERIRIVRVEMPVAALVAMGLAAAAPDPSASAEAEAMVSEDGRIRGVRLVSLTNSDFSSDRRAIP